MFNFVILVLNILPLIGMIMMERGALGPDIYAHGYANGASLAYAAHLLALIGGYLLTFAVLRRTILPSRLLSVRSVPPALYSVDQYRWLAPRALAVNLLLLAFVLFVSGASNVVFGSMNKIEFRLSARFGYVAFLCRDFLSPMLSALVAYVYCRCHHRTKDALLLGANLLVTAAAGAIWGFRSTVLMMLVPAALMLVPRMTIVRGTAAVGGSLAVLVMFSTFYEGYPARVAFDAIVTRASVGTANSAWLVWDLASTAPELIPPYGPTLQSAAPIRMRRLVGFDADAPLDVSNPTDYTTLATLLAKNFSQGVDGSSNVTTTVFGEGLVALGARWFVLMSLAAGIVVGLVRTMFEFGQQHGRPLMAIIAANYFMVSVFNWLNSGGVVVLFFVPFVLNYVVTYWVARMLLRGAGIPLSRGVRGRPGHTHDLTRSVPFDAPIPQQP
ncbi:MAG: hypothetical protein ACRD1U_05620 [Vicinamibacterales bacterium]